MFGKTPGTYAPYEYDAVNVLARAVTLAGSADPARVTIALGNVYAFKGATGTISFEPNGDRLLPAYITADVRDGGFTPGMALDQDGNWIPAA